MKALIFNHHPDYTWQLQKALEETGIECYIGTYDLTIHLGADYCSSSNDGMLRQGANWYSEQDLFGSQNTFKYANSLDGMDYIFSMNRDIVQRIDFPSSRLFFCACVSWDLNGLNDLQKYTKITSHHQASKFNAHYVPYFVQQRGVCNKGKYVTQLIEGFRNSPYTEELMILNNQETLPVIIAGSNDAPAGVVNDWDTLRDTRLLVHHKEYGTNCNAVMKALDCGIPIYMSKNNKETIGMGDLPDDLFIFSDNYNIIDAYAKSGEIDNKSIQDTFRTIRNAEKAAQHLQKIL
jgi:hypothetical protein